MGSVNMYDPTTGQLRRIVGDDNHLRDEMVAEYEPNSTASHAYSKGDQFLYNEVLYTATKNIAIGDDIVPGNVPELVGTLSISNDVSKIVKIRVDNTEYTSFDNIPIYGNSVIALYQAEYKGWIYTLDNSMMHMIGRDYVCHFYVPSQASGSGTVYVEDEGGDTKLNFYLSEGWASNVTAVNLGEGTTTNPNCTPSLSITEQLANAGSGGAGHTILDEDGTTYPQRSKLQFEGCEVTDDSTNGITKIKAEGGVTGVKGNAESTYREGNVNLTPANIGAYSKSEVDTALNGKLGTSGASTNTTVAFTSNDLAANTTVKTNTTTNQPSTVAKLTSGETLGSVFGKLSSMFASVRKLWNTVGSTAIPSSLGSTVTGAISNLTPYFNWFGYNGSGSKQMTVSRAGYYYVYIHGSGDNGSSTMTLEIQIDGKMVVYATGSQGGVIASAMHIIYAKANSKLKFIFSNNGGNSGEVTDSNTMAWTQGGFIYLGSSH